MGAGLATGALDRLPGAWDDPGMRERSDLDAAARLLDQERPAEALESLRGLDPADPEVALHEAFARLELHQEAECLDALARASVGVDSNDPELRWVRAELEFRCWRLDRARAIFEALQADDPTIDTLDRLARIAELTGDEAAAAQFDRELAELDPDAAPLAETLDEEQFDAVLEHAIGALPLVYREALERAELIVAPLPERELCIPGRELETPPDLLGLFVGATALERTEDGGHLMPTPVIYVFQRNLERFVSSEEELRDEARVTLYHELGHLLGHDEHGVAGLGLA